MIPSIDKDSVSEAVIQTTEMDSISDTVSESIDKCKCSESEIQSNDKVKCSADALKRKVIQNEVVSELSTKDIRKECMSQSTNQDVFQRSADTGTATECVIQASDKGIITDGEFQVCSKKTFGDALPSLQQQPSDKGIYTDGECQASSKETLSGALNTSVNQELAPSDGTGTVTEKFKSLGNVYSKATGTFDPPWKTNVNLLAPKSYKHQIPDGDKHIHDYYDSLQYTLLETGYPETVDRTDTPRTKHNHGQITVAIMSSPCECIGLLLEGGDQIPDGFHLILSPSWISREPSNTTTTSQQTKKLPDSCHVSYATNQKPVLSHVSDLSNETSDLSHVTNFTNNTSDLSCVTNLAPTLHTVYVHKAITFHKNGQTFLDEFEVPRKTTYFINFFTHTITGGQRNDGLPFETDIDCPISSPVPLAAIVDDKVWTRSIMADVGMAVPETLAFRYRPLYDVTVSTDQLQIVNVYDKDNMEMEGIVEEFLMGEIMNRASKVVVKPSGPGVYGSIGVSYHSPQEVTSICDAVRDLLRELEPGSSVLVERFIDTLNREPKDGQRRHVPWHADERYGFRMRSTICRDFNDTPVTTMINCGVALKSQPINGDNTISQSLSNTLLAFGVVDACERQEFEKRVQQQSEDVLRGIIDKEKAFDQEKRGAMFGQTDVIGIDFCVEDQDGILVPFGIEVNSHDCIINCQIYDFMQALNQRTASLMPNTGLSTSANQTQMSNKTYLPWIQNMAVRSQLYLMRDKVVLVIGSGGYSKRYIWTAAAEYGIKIVLVDWDADNCSKDMVYRYLPYNLQEHTKDENHAREIAAILGDLKIVPDGCLTFWEDCGPLAALVREELGIGNGPSYEAALNGKKKSRTQEVLRSRQDDTPHWPRAYLYSSQSYRLEDSTLATTAERINYPVVLKLEHGSSAVGVTLVHDPTELIREYTKTTSSLQCDADFPGVGLGHDNSMVAMEYLEGSEHDVDVVIFDRQLVAAFVSDNGPTMVPLFTETSAVMPSTLPEGKQVQLVVAAYQCCTEIGLTHGTFNVELRMTPTGPKLMEINARMGGFYIRDWIKRLYDVDLVLINMMIACGIKPFVPKCPPRGYLMGVMLVPSLHRDVLTRDVTKGFIERGEIIVNEFSESYGADHGRPMFEEPFAHVAVKGASVSEAKDKLIRICDAMGIACGEYNVTELLREF